MSKHKSNVEWVSHCVLICGHPCCLKTSIVRELSYRYEIFALHGYQAGKINLKWNKPYRIQRQARYENLFKILNVILSCNLPVIVEGTFECKRERLRVIKICQEHKVHLIGVYCFSSNISIIEKRFKYRGRKSYGPDHQASTIAIYHDSLKSFTSINDKEIKQYAGYAEFDSAKRELKIIKASSESCFSILSLIKETGEKNVY